MNDIKVIVEKMHRLQPVRESLSYAAVELFEKKAVINERCTLCGACVTACKKYNAIVITRKTFRGRTSPLCGDCLYVEHKEGKISPIVPEIIGAARNLKKDLQKPIAAILLGHRCAPWPTNSSPTGWMKCG